MIRYPHDFELSSDETEKIMFLWVPGATSATGVPYFVIMTGCPVALTLSLADNQRALNLQPGFASRHPVRAYDEIDLATKKIQSLGLTTAGVSLLGSSRIKTTPAAMLSLMAFSTQRDEVGFRVVTKCASPFEVVNIKILAPSTHLTAPSIAL